MFITGSLSEFCSLKEDFPESIIKEIDFLTNYCFSKSQNQKIDGHFPRMAYNYGKNIILTGFSFRDSTSNTCSIFLMPKHFHITIILFNLG